MGIYCSDKKLRDTYDNFCIRVSQPPTGPDADKPFFTGKVMVGKKEYTKAGFKKGEYDFCHSKKVVQEL